MSLIFEIFVPIEFYHLDGKLYDTRKRNSDKIKLQISFYKSEPDIEYISQDDYDLLTAYDHHFDCKDWYNSQMKLLKFLSSRAKGNFKQRILRLIDKHKLTK